MDRFWGPRISVRKWGIKKTKSGTVCPCCVLGHDFGPFFGPCLGSAQCGSSHQYDGWCIFVGAVFLFQYRRMVLCVRSVFSWQVRFVFCQGPGNLHISHRCVFIASKASVLTCCWCWKSS